MAKDRLTFRYFSKFFLTISFPTHFWTVMMVFRDFESISNRTNPADGFGYIGYSMLFALAESLVLALIVWGLSLVIARKQAKEKIFSILVGLYFILASANILDMLAHINNGYRISMQYLHGLETYPGITYGLIAGAILLGFAIFLVLILRFPKVEKVILDLLERVMLLGYLFLFLDAIGLIVVIVRNVR